LDKVMDDMDRNILLGNNQKITQNYLETLAPIKGIQKPLIDEHLE